VPTKVGKVTEALAMCHRLVVYPGPASKAQDREMIILTTVLRDNTYNFTISYLSVF